MTKLYREKHPDPLPKRDAASLDRLISYLSGSSGFKLKLWRVAEIDFYGPGIVFLGIICITGIVAIVFVILVRLLR